MSNNNLYNNIKNPSFNLIKFKKSLQTWLIVFFTSLLLITILPQQLIFPLFFLTVISLFSIVTLAVRIFFEKIKIKKNIFLFVERFGSEKEFDEMSKIIKRQIFLFKTNYINTVLIILLSCTFVIINSLKTGSAGLFPILIGLVSGIFISISNKKSKDEINTLESKADEIIISCMNSNKYIKENKELNNNNKTIKIIV